MRVRLNQGKTQSLSVTFGGLPGTSVVAPTPNDNTALINNTLTFIDDTSSWDGHALRRTFVLPYIQDEWKATRDLTLNIGLRWEYYSPVTEAHDRVKIFDLAGCHGVCPSTDSWNFRITKTSTRGSAWLGLPAVQTAKPSYALVSGSITARRRTTIRNAALESDRQTISLL
jgi:hypothetical protein